MKQTTELLQKLNYKTTTSFQILTFASIERFVLVETLPIGHTNKILVI